MLPEVKVPEHLVKLKQAAMDAHSDEAYIKGEARVYSDNAERQVLWDIKCAIAEERVGKSRIAYDLALMKYLKLNEEEKLA